MSEQELKKALTDWVTSYKDIAERNALAETPDESAGNLIRLLKTMGYEQVWTKCPDCGGTKRIFRLPVTALGETSNEFPCPTCKGTGRKRKLVKWDREKVATHFALCKGRLSTEEQQHRFADQLKEILAEGEL